MTLTQLEYVIAVDTYQSFGEAAKKCFVTQPTLSMQIKKLEDTLNVLIFDRSKKPILTTDIGRKIIDQARIAVLESERIHELIKEQKGEITGTLRIGIIPTLSPYLIPLFISSFIDQYPDIEIFIEEILSNEILSRLQNDQLDIGILAAPITESGLIEFPLFEEDFLLYISSQHPYINRPYIEIEDLNMKDLWLLKEGHCLRSQAINICGEQPIEKQQLNFESGSLETLKKIVDQQKGYTLIPELAVRDMSKSQQANIKRFNAPQPVRAISLVIHRGYLKRKLIDLLKAELVKNLPKNLKKKSNTQPISWR